MRRALSPQQPRHNRPHRAAAADYDTSDYASLANICGGSFPFLDREIGRLATELRPTVAICLNMPEASGT